MTAKRKISWEAGKAAIEALQPILLVDPQLTTADPQTVATATRFLLEELKTLAPGNAVEVRVPPYGAVQCLPGPKHTRGTPSNVIEMSPAGWIALALGSLTWDDAVTTGIMLASGLRADISTLLPLIRI